MGTLGDILGALAALILAFFLAAFIFQIAWDLSVVSYFDMEPLTYIQAMGFTLLLYGIKNKLKLN